MDPLAKAQLKYLHFVFSFFDFQLNANYSIGEAKESPHKQSKNKTTC